MSWLRVAALVTAGIALTASGCSGGDQKPPAASATRSASPSTTPAPTAEPSPSPESLPSAPKARRGAAGEKAFAQYVIDAWGYALRTNDAGPLLSLSSRKKPCEGCRLLESELEKRKKNGWYVDFAGAHVSRLTLTSKAGVIVANAVIDISESNSYNDDGSYRSTNPAHPRGTFQVRMRLVKKEYQLVSFTVT